MLKLNISNNPYINYGILTEDHSEEIQILEKKFNKDSYIKLYNKCLVDIGTKVLKAKIKPALDQLSAKSN